MLQRVVPVMLHFCYKLCPDGPYHLGSLVLPYAMFGSFSGCLGSDPIHVINLQPLTHNTYHILVACEGVASLHKAAVLINDSHTGGGDDVRQAGLGPVPVRQAAGLGHAGVLLAQLTVLDALSHFIAGLDEEVLKHLHVGAVPGAKVGAAVLAEATGGWAWGRCRGGGGKRQG